MTQAETVSTSRIGRRISSSSGSLASELEVDELRRLIAQAHTEDDDHGRVKGATERSGPGAVVRPLARRILEAFEEQQDGKAEHRRQRRLAESHGEVAEVEEQRPGEARDLPE